MIVAHSSPWIAPEDMVAIGEVLNSRMIAAGDTRRSFERQLASYSGYRFALATVSGTAAQVLLLRALGIGVGDEVVLPTYVCRSVYEAVILTGAEPVLCDVSQQWHMTPSDVERVRTTRTKAIVLVHIFGIDASHPGFAEFGVPIIDDLCQGFGLRLADQSSGLAFCSFHATKCLTTGEGGAILCNVSSVQERLQEFQDRREPLTLMSDLQATLGLKQLSRYEDFLGRRRDIAEQYFESIPTALTDELRSIGGRSIYYRFPLRVGGPVESLVPRFAERGIAVRRGVDELIHRAYGSDDLGFSRAIEWFDSTLSIPLYPALTASDVQRVILAVKQVCGRE